MKVDHTTVIPLALLIILSLPLFYYISELSDEHTEMIQDELEMVVGFYMSGNGFDDQLINDDISDTLGLSSDNMEYYYLVDYDGFGNTHFFTGRNYSRISLNVSLFMPYDSTELDMGSTEVLNGFADHISRIEAQKHCLVLWGHGRGYEGVCFDEGSGLKGSEIRTALEGKGIDLLILDACEMICAEFLYELDTCVDYVMGSEKDIPDRGLDYFGGFTSFIENGSNNEHLLAEKVMVETVSYYTRDPSRFSIQLSLIDLERFREFSTQFRKRNLSIGPDHPCYFESGKRFDLGLYLEDAGEEELFESLKRSILYQVTLPSSTGIDISNVYGISILSPEVGSKEQNNPFLYQFD